MALRLLPAVAAEKRAQAAVARSILLRLLASDGLARLDDGRDPSGRVVEGAAYEATRALAHVTALLGILNADCDRLDA